MIKINNCHYDVIGITGGRVKLRRLTRLTKSSTGETRWIGCGKEPSFKIRYDYEVGWYIVAPSNKSAEKIIIPMNRIMASWEWFKMYKEYEELK